MNRNQSCPRFVAATLSLTLFACSGGGGSSSSATGAVSGALSVLEVDQTTLEAEPNDNASNAHVVGVLNVGDSRTLVGHSTDDGSDVLDVFRIALSERSLVTVTLTSTDQGADLDVTLVDTISLLSVAAFATPQANESGTFVAKGSMFVLVNAPSGSSDYQLTLDVAAAPSPVLEVEPNDTGVNAQYLGEMVAGDTLVLSGNLTGADVSDRLMVALPQAAVLNLSLAMDTGQDLDLEIFDVTADLNNPNPFASFETDSEPEVGSVNVAAMTLVGIRIFPFMASTGDWTLTLSVPSPLLGSAEPLALSASPRGDVELQASYMKSPDLLRHFNQIDAPFLPGEVVVASQAGTSLARSLPLHGGRVELSSSDLNKVTFDLPLGLSDSEKERYTVALTATLAGQSGVRYAEPNYLYQATAFDTNPNDNFYNLQWHYSALNLPAAWDIQTGDAAIIVAILDTGSTPHPDLDGREIPGIDMISNLSIAGDGDGIDGDPFDVGDSTGPQPSSFHGSHVAGTVGAETNNGQGVAGVTWAGGIMHVRLLGIGGGSNFDITQGILYAAGLANASGSVPAQAAHVMNMSLGGGGFAQSMQDAVTDARNAGTVVIAAAGNENSSTPSYPAAYADVISVAAVGYDLSRAPYSNFHASVDLAAPGGNVGVDLNGDGYADGVLSTKPDDTVNPTNYANYAFYQGTSMAAPHVAGVAALLLAENPALTVAQVENLLTSTATDLGSAGQDVQFGHGIVNALAALQQASGGGGGAPDMNLGDSNALFNLAQTDAASCLRISVGNRGGGSLAVASATPSTQSGGNWLSATPIAAVSGTATDTASIEICADPSGLADGLYRGSVAVVSNGGNQTIDVVLNVGPTGPGTNYTLFILAVDSVSLASVAQVTVQTTGNLSYSFPSLAAGSYFIVAGTDEDNDNVICDPGEPLCGVYPSLESPSAVAVAEGQSLTGHNFPVQGGFSALATGSGGFRLLHPRHTNATIGGNR